MKKNLDKYTVFPQSTVLAALKKISNNEKGFLIVIDENYRVLGTLTDGDMRRGFIEGKTVNEEIVDIYAKNYKYIMQEDDILIAIDMFKEKNIKFLPILDNEMRLTNIITKRQMQALLLHNTYVDLDYDFMEVDENIIDYEIYPREWGFYKTTVINDHFQSKIICVNPKSQLSLQSHQYREEYWVIVYGQGIVQIGEEKFEARPGKTFFIPKGCKHRLINSDECDNLMVTEVQIGEYFGEEDIIRYEDAYGRI